MNFKGFLSERDYARKIVLKKSFKDTFVHEIMERIYGCCIASDDLDHCMELITTKKSKAFTSFSR
jgi:hypothetical protein